VVSDTPHALAAVRLPAVDGEPLIAGDAMSQVERTFVSEPRGRTARASPADPSISKPGLNVSDPRGAAMDLILALLLWVVAVWVGAALLLRRTRRRSPRPLDEHRDHHGVQHDGTDHGEPARPTRDAARPTHTLRG
jgi:hypothetical protein